MIYGSGGNRPMNVYYIAGFPVGDELYHHGILGQKWGIRRYQNPDGSLTDEGKIRYKQEVRKMAQKDAQRYSDAKAAYGEGAGTRRKLLDKEINEKKRNKEYAKAYEEAQKRVDIAKSLRKAESLHRNSGLFVRGRYLTDKGKTIASSLVRGAGSGLLAGAGTWLTVSGIVSTDVGKRLIKSGALASDICLAAAGIAAASTIAKGARDAVSIGYYEKNRKF